MKYRIIPILIATLLFPICANAQTADVIYTNAKFYTVNEKQPWAEAVAVKDGRFIRVGKTAEMKTLTGSKTQAVDLHGHMVLPGLVDSHVHPFATLLFNGYLDFSAPQSLESIQREVKTYADGGFHYPREPGGTRVWCSGRWKGEPDGRGGNQGIHLERCLRHRQRVRARLH